MVEVARAAHEEWGFVADLNLTVQKFAAGGALTLERFEKEWKAAKLDVLHAACPVEMTPEEHLQLMFAASIAGVMEPEGETDEAVLASGVGHLYCLFTLHATQRIKPALPVYVSIQALQELGRLLDRVEASSIEGHAREDPFLVLHSLFERDAVAVGACDGAVFKKRLVLGVGRWVTQPEDKASAGLAREVMEFVVDKTEKLLDCEGVEAAAGEYGGLLGRVNPGLSSKAADLKETYARYLGMHKVSVEGIFEKDSQGKGPLLLDGAAAANLENVKLDEEDERVLKVLPPKMRAKVRQVLAASKQKREAVERQQQEEERRGAAQQQPMSDMPTFHNFTFTQKPAATTAATGVEEDENYDDE